MITRKSQPDRQIAKQRNCDHGAPRFYELRPLWPLTPISLRL